MARKNNNRAKLRRPKWSRHEAAWVAMLIGSGLAVGLVWILLAHWF